MSGNQSVAALKSGGARRGYVGVGELPHDPEIRIIGIVQRIPLYLSGHVGRPVRERIFENVTCVRRVAIGIIIVVLPVGHEIAVQQSVHDLHFVGYVLNA